MGRFTKILLAAVAAVVGLAGCASPSNALVVNGQTVLAVADIGAVRQAYAEVVEPFGYSPLSDAGVVNGYAQGAVADHLIELFGLELGEAKLRNSLTLDLSIALYDQPLTRDYVLAAVKWDVIRTLLSEAGVDDATLLALLDGLDIEVNPRYGQWSYQAVSLVNVGLPLAEPLASLV